MKKNNLKIIFNYFDHMIENCFSYAETMKKKSVPIVSIFCEYTPRELIMAAGGIPVCVCAGSNKTISKAEEDLPSNICPLIKSSYGYAQLKTNPFLEMADLIVGETTCDGKKKMFELLKESKDVYLLELTQKSDSSEAFNHWKKELLLFKTFLENKFSTTITQKKLKEAIRIMNKERQLRMSIARLMKQDPPPITGCQVLSLKSSISGIKDDFNMYQKLIDCLKNSALQPKKQNKIPRTLMTGVPMPYMAEKVIEIIEASGAIVVAQESCTGIKPIYELVDEQKDPISALAEKYFHLPCSVMTPNTRRFELLDTLIREFSVDAVVELIWLGCHTYSIESYSIRKHIEKHSIPYLKIETDYSPSDYAQIKVRVQALLEMVKAKNKIRVSV